MDNVKTNSLMLEDTVIMRIIKKHNRNTNSALGTGFNQSVVNNKWDFCSFYLSKMKSWHLRTHRL